jgi:hypothetical protein
MNQDENMTLQTQTNNPKPDDMGSVLLQGHIKIFDPETQEVFVDKSNAIHYENFSQALALSVGNKATGFIHEMHFGNGGTSVDATGIITYLPPNTTGANSQLYNPTYYKVVDDNSNLNTDPVRNNITIRHIAGKLYTDILITCLLDYGEPSGQAAFDNATDLNSDYVFDELGLKSWEGTEVGVGNGKLLTHVVFHPVQKSLNRLIQIEYTIRVQTLTNLTTAG